MMLMRARASGVPVIAQSSTLIDKYTGTNTATIGTHQIGDYFVAYASRDGSSTAPTVPGGWTTISSGGANALGYALAWKIAASTSETAGTFTNATSLIIVHERPASGWTPSMGAFANNASGSGVSPAIPALTLQNTDNTSRVIAFYASVAADITGLTTPPSGMEYIGQTQDATDTSSAYRTTSTVSSWSTAATSFSGTTGAVRATAVEIKLTYSTGTAPDAPSSLAAAAVSSTQINLTWVDNSNTETGFVVERSADGSTGWSVITTTAANATSHSDTGLTEETAYYYRVKATNTYGDSAYTSVANDTTDAAPSYTPAVDLNFDTDTSLPSFFDTYDYGTISTTQKYGGSGKSVACAVSSGGHDWGLAGRLSSRLVQGDEVWVRFRTFFPSGYNFSANPHLKFFRIDQGSVASGGHGAHIDWYIRMVGEGSDSSNVGHFDFIQEDVQSWLYDTTTLPTGIVRNTWQTWNFYYKLHSTAASARIRLWRDSTLLVDSNARATLGASGNVVGSTSDGNAQGFMFSTYWNGGAPATQTCYIDDFQIATSASPPTATDSGGKIWIGV